MKSLIITIFTALTLATGAAKANDNATLNDKAAVVLTDVTAINNIEVHGNVELYVSDGAKDEVKVYNKYYSESALVQSVNGTLRITSYKNEKLVVWVTANDLRKISAFDNAEVKSFGNISKIEFDVDLHNDASAKLNMDVYSAKVTVADHAKADLKGSATEFSLNRDLTANVVNNNLAIIHYTENKVNFATEVDMAGL